MRTLAPYRSGHASIFDGLDHIFDSFFAEPPAMRSRAPAVDIREERDAYLVHAELPGVPEGPEGQHRPQALHADRI